MSLAIKAEVKNKKMSFSQSKYSFFYLLKRQISLSLFVSIYHASVLNRMFFAKFDLRDLFSYSRELHYMFENKILSLIMVLHQLFSCQDWHASLNPFPVGSFLCWSSSWSFCPTHSTLKHIQIGMKSKRLYFCLYV